LNGDQLAELAQGVVKRALAAGATDADEVPEEAEA